MCIRMANPPIWMVNPRISMINTRIRMINPRIRISNPWIRMGSHRGSAPPDPHRWPSDSRRIEKIFKIIQKWSKIIPKVFSGLFSIKTFLRVTSHPGVRSTQSLSHGKSSNHAYSRIHHVYSRNYHSYSRMCTIRIRGFIIRGIWAKYPPFNLTKSSVSHIRMRIPVKKTSFSYCSSTSYNPILKYLT